MKILYSENKQVNRFVRRKRRYSVKYDFGIKILLTTSKQNLPSVIKLYDTLKNLTTTNTGARENPT